MKVRARLLSPAVLGVFLSTAWTASADDADTARALFREGRSLAQDGKYDVACPKFEQSLKLDPGIGTKFNLADCYEHVGRTATARTLFLEVAAVARQAGQDDRERMAESRAQKLEPQIHRLTVVVKGTATGLHVERDGVEVVPSAWGVPQFVDPGPHDLRVTAPDKKPWTTHVDVPVTGDATVQIPELEDANAPVAAAAVPAPEPEAAKAEPSTPAPAETSEPPPAKTDLTIPLVIYGGLGASAVLAGTALILYKSANDKAAGICPSGVNCTRDDINRHQGYVNDARDARTLAYVGLGVAGASLITGGVIAILRSNREGKPEQAAFSAGPTFTPGGFGGAVEGRF